MLLERMHLLLFSLLLNQPESDFYISVILRKVTLVMVGLDNAGKTATAKGIQGGKLKIFMYLLNSVKLF